MRMKLTGRTSAISAKLMGFVLVLLVASQGSGPFFQMQSVPAQGTQNMKKKSWGRMMLCEFAGGVAAG